MYYIIYIIYYIYRCTQHHLCVISPGLVAKVTSEAAKTAAAADDADGGELMDEGNMGFFIGKP